MSEPSLLDDARRAWQEEGLRRADLADDPLDQVRRWHAEVAAAGLHEPDAMVLSSVGGDGVPSSRYVLVRGLDHGFVLYTDLDSRKGRELAAHPVAALCAAWHPAGRQVRAVGRVEPVSEAESDAYFAGRPRGSQVGAWASSPQSRDLADRAELERRVREVEARFEGQEVPRPARWGGLRLVPEEVEVWQGRRDRLHDRFAYRRDPSRPGGWTITRLAP